uniref:CDGSH iron-sulfur domain-containing protein 2 n=1 Tax=Sus scrofa TaxID=9823 RepID=A0A8D1QEE7_PIG
MSPLFQPLVHALVARLLVESGRDRGCGLRARRGASPAVEWIAAVTIAAGTAAIGYLAYKRFYVKDHRNKSMVNPHIQKDNPKVVHAFDMEDLGDKAVYCRCWRSKKLDQKRKQMMGVYQCGRKSLTNSVTQEIIILDF